MFNSHSFVEKHIKYKKFKNGGYQIRNLENGKTQMTLKYAGS